MKSAPAIIILSALFVVCLPATADEQVRQVQEELRKRNLYFGEVDGQATPETKSAVQRFQQRKGFTGGGDLTPETLRALDVPAKLAVNSGGRTEKLPDGPVLRSDVARQVSASDRAFLESLATGDVPPVAEGPDEVSPGFAPSQPAPPTLALPPAPVPPPAVLATPVPAAPPRPEPNEPDEVAKPPKPRPAEPRVGDMARLETRPKPITPPSPVPVSPAAEPAPAIAPAPAKLLHEFVERYLAACMQEQPAAELAFYAPQVKYFDHGLVDFGFISRDVKRFYERWPKRDYELLDCQSRKKGREGEWDVTFKISFHYEGENGRRASGQSLNIFRVRGDAEGWKFISMKEQRLRP